MKRNLNPATIIISGAVLLTVISGIARNRNHITSFSPKKIAVSDTPPAIDLPYPFQDNHQQEINSSQNNSNGLYLSNPSNIDNNVEYDPQSNEYILSQTIGSQFYSNPSYLSFEDFLKQRNEQSLKENFENLSNSNSLLNHKGVIPQVDVKSQLLDRLFGGNEVDIRPNGNIDLTFGYNRQNIQNPTLTAQQRKQGGFQFDMNIQMNVVGQIGKKLKLTTNYNTQSSFDFENQVKLEYTGFQDEIIKKIEAGNVSLPLNTTLIPGSQSLFGLKTQLQFGRLMVTSVISQQKSQAQNITIQGGAQTQNFEVNADQYDENRKIGRAHV